MSSLKQVIYNALFKASTPLPGTIFQEYETPEAARDAFIALVMSELFPNEPVVEPVKEPVVEPVKSPKKSPKKSPANKAAKEAEKQAAKEAKEAEKLAAKAAKEAEILAAKAAKEAEILAAKAAKEAEKQAAKEAKEAEKLAAKAAKEAEKQAAKEAAKALMSPKKSPKPKVSSTANLPKIDPTWRKALKEADKGRAKELEPELLKYVNEMSNVAFNSKGVKEHISDYIAKITQPVVDDTITAELEIVEFGGKEYYVNPETQRVYEGEMDEDGSLKVTKPVGYVGMADFKDMHLD